MTSTAEPTLEAISDVVAKTACRERQAKLYLKKSSNDVAAAIELYQSHYSVKSPGNTSVLTLPYSTRASSPPSISENSEALTSLDPRSDEDLLNDGTPDSESEGELQPPDSSKWDFVLPNVPAAQYFQPGGKDGSAQFSMEDLVGAVQHGATFDQIEAYLGHHSHPNANTVRGKINNPVQGFHPMFYVVASNNEWIIRLFAKYGGNMDAVYGNPPFPLLAFAIINSKTIEYETTSSVAMLLSLGADSSVIPKPFYSPFCQDLPESGPSEEDLDGLDDSGQSWCKSPEMRTNLAETLNLTQRYHLEKSSKLEKPTERQRQVARRSNSEDLFGIPYFLVGQSAATDSLTKNFLHHMLRRHRDPLVLVFAGPSGHGKTELARRLGFLLSLDLHVSDCTIVSRETELFGPRKPFIGSEEGAPLNNFLARKSGEKSIIFLDEFEKATPDIWNALLIPFDKGEYQDRRNLKTVDCSKTIWIIATNGLDEKIENFCKRNPKIFEEDDQEERESLLESLNEAMKEEFKAQFKPPLTGRISAFIPFMPFSFSETCIGVHKYLLELATEVRRPVNTSKGNHEQLLGNIRLKIRLDASVCQVLAKGYDTQLGIRSLRKIVRDTVAKKLDYEYMLTHDLISEGGPREDYVVFVSNGKLRVASVPATAAAV